MIRFICKLDFETPEETRPNVVWKLNKINSALRFGSFAPDPENGQVLFTYGMICNDVPSAELVYAVMTIVIETVDTHDGDLSKITVVKSNIPDTTYG